MSLLRVMNLAQGGMAAQAGALAATGENITNATTPGYVRRMARLETLALGRGVAGGVHLAGIDRAFDRAAYARVVSEQGLYGYAQARHQSLVAAETALVPAPGQTIGDEVNGLFASFHGLSLDPADPTARRAVLAEAEDVARAFRSASDALSSQRSDLYESAQQSAGDLSQLLGQIAQLNQKIVENPNDDSGRAELMDQRDELVRQASEELGTDVVAAEDGSVTLLSSGIALVEGSRAAQVSVGLDTGGNLRFTATRGGTPADITSRVESGVLGGLRQARDIDLVGVQGQLDDFAYELASAINAVHSAGVGLDGASGRPLFTGPGGAPLAPPPGTAWSLAVNPAVVADPRALAAASTAAGLPGEGDVALDLAALADAPLASGTTPSASWGALTGGLGSLIDGAGSELTLRESTVAHATTLRESASGVSLDEEMVNLSRYQRAYEASLRVLRTADEMLAELVNML
jgi:flagellar hook-associated protein 1 FlgK